MGMFLIFGVTVLLSVVVVLVAFYAKIWDWIFDMIAIVFARLARKRANKKRERDLKNRT
ncbi:hypothetical protein [Acinetobacter gerneri]|uniref:Uncharacterized protein n=1 Tax=Acinetobacter gerneri DSM 14967 = CIP 107464 = MTCC 9824 TaxID=1120926 RepID=N8YF95_9GAMM|nr:hypothetical protein [Acinetobacter gerneri]ENV35477.1 hypothetical protein F960_00284 [Acinetobacter gerneri DSM 14967 = CIP 107464 = MTCC 9824]EPR82496.1 hypothetical protein L289_2990 [Acinetobacter gerneri DSM 14967 = CIP 107464 = MTCC 9824]